MKDKIKDKHDKKTRLLAMLSNKEDEMALKQWKSVINQMSIDGQWFKKQIGVICVAVFGIIIYITCRYQAQQEIILEEQLKIERQDWMFRSLTRSSELTLKSRQSQIESALYSFGDSTLKVSTEAPFTTIVKKD